MSFRRMFGVFILVSLVTACAASSQRLNYVRIGMQRSEVIQVMGEPSYTSARDGVEVLNYRLSTGGLFDEQYVVRLKNGRVDLFGQRYDWNAAY